VGRIVFVYCLVPTTVASALFFRLIEVETNFPFTNSRIFHAFAWDLSALRKSLPDNDEDDSAPERDVEAPTPGRVASRLLRTAASRSSAFF
jgi:hypothetical protein